MTIRRGTYHDAPFLKLLLEEQRLKTTNSFLVGQLNAWFKDSDHVVWVLEVSQVVTGFAVVHLLPQVHSDEKLFFVSYLLGDAVANVALLAFLRKLGSPVFLEDRSGLIDGY